MTTPTTEQSGQPIARVEAEPDTRLEQLHATYTRVKAAADAYAAELKAITDAIKAELANAAPGQSRIDLVPAPGSGDAPLRLQYVESWRVDSRKLKAEDPETYVRYAKRSGAWTLKAVSS